MQNKDILWKDVLGVVRVSISGANFSTWFPQTFIVSVKRIEGNRQIVEIGCTSSFVRDTLERRYFGLLQDSLNQVTGVKNDLVFVIRQNPNLKGPKVPSPLFIEEERNANPQILERAGIPAGFGFENFAVSTSNQLAWAAADSVTKNPGRLYNPLFLWGGVGVGKTHLAAAAAREILTNFPDKRILYSTGDQFIVGIIEAIRTKTTSEFKRKYRNIDGLIVDDVQFIAGKDTVQTEFFNTFNVIKGGGGQVILTSDRPPGEVLKLEARLRNRFEAGLIVDIEPPDFELRVAILLIKARERGIEIPQNLAQEIAGVFGNARQIEGFINRLVIRSHYRNAPVTQELIEELLNQDKLGVKNGELRMKLNPKEIIGVVCNYFSITKKQLLGKDRKRSLVVPRHILMYLLRQELGLTLTEVGRIVGGRDHTTIIHGVEKIESQIIGNKELYGYILGIKRSLWG